jgi:hypothetical protein
VFAVAVPSSLARRYAPFLILAGVQVLLVALVPSTGGPEGGSTVSAGPGAALGPEIGAPTTDGTTVIADGTAAGGAAGATGAAGGTAGGGTAGGTSGTGTRVGSGGGGAGGSGPKGRFTDDRSKCAKDGVRQQDVTITSPPCVPRWEGDNGGATYRGVTAKTVNIIHYRPQSNEQVDAILRTQGLAASAAEEAKARDAFKKFFEKRYEMYGRTINWIPVQGTCEITPPATECFRTEAKRLNTQWTPFAVFWTTATVQGELFEQWTQLGVVNIGGWHFHNEFVVRNRPYHWDVFMDGTRTVRNLAEYWCKKMRDKNATLAGDPTMHDRKRKLGVITQKYDYTSKNGVDFINLVRGGMCGGPEDAALPYYTESDITKAQTAATGAIQYMRDNQVTTLVFLSDPIGPRFFTQEATAQRYYPENLLAGSGLIDYDTLGRLYDPAQWRNAFGVGHLAEPIPFGQSDAAKAAADVGVSGLYSGANLLYAYMHLAVTQVQMAGPDLNPTNVERGMLGLPPSGGWERTKNPAAVMVKFGPNDYTAIEDSRHTWWNPSMQSKIDDGTGGYEAVGGGRRWEIGTWAPGEPKQ